MLYCSKCGKELAEDQKFCHDCGSGVGETNSKSNKKWIFILGGIFLVSILMFFMFNGDSSETGFSVGGDFNDEKKDSDNDGLTDIEEKNIGTNPQLYDTDGDTLSDYQEYNVLGTNPLNKNTDGDRYNDNEDKEPLKKNTANIYIEGTSSSELNYFNVGIILLSGGLGALNPNLELYSTNVDLEIINDGNDYSSQGSYDVAILIGDDIIDTKTFSFGRINAGSSIPQSTIFSTTIKDIPSQLISLITQDGDSSVEIRNINYERF